MNGACIVGQSGGPTAVINASLEGVIKAGFRNPDITKVYGALNGIEGIINEQIIDFSDEDMEEIDRLRNTPSAALGSVRYFLGDDFDKDDSYKKILATFKKYDIRYFFYIGGNDSMDSCHKIYQYLKQNNYECCVIGIPKTIDNDLVGCDHTPGYGSACKFISTTINEIYLDTSSYKKGRVTIIEIMGRDAGWLTASSKLASLNGADPDLIYLPEVPFDIDAFLAEVKKIYEKKQKVLIAVSEGIKDKNGEYILKYRNFNNNDPFGHLQLGGVSSVLCEIVTNTLGFPVRAIELNLPQRCAAHIASLTDIQEAYMCGKKAVDYATKGESGKMISLYRQNDVTRYSTVELSSVATLIKTVPENFITPSGNQITEEYIKYALPLIQGESPISFRDGLPLFTKLKKKIVKIENV